MKKWYKICGLVGFFLTICLDSYSQVSENKLVVIKSGDLSFFSKAKNSTPRETKNTVSAKNFQKNISLLVTPATATQQFGFFCRAELKSDAALKFPVRFRLGSLQYCDYMEGKAKHY